MNKIKIDECKGKLLNDLRKIKKITNGNYTYGSDTEHFIRFTGKKDNDFITLTVTDGCRITDINLNTTEKLENDFEIKVYKKDFYDLIRLIDKNKAGGVNFEIKDINDDYVVFSGNNWEHQVRTHDFQYFDTDSFFDMNDKFNDCFVVNTSELKKALKELIKDHTRNKKTGIIIRNDPYNNEFILESMMDCYKLNVNYAGLTSDNDFDLRAVNPRFLLNAINDTGKNSECKLCFCDKNKRVDPIKIIENGNRHLVLPIRLDD